MLKFLDKVKIKSGFYSGCIGLVSDKIEENFGSTMERYRVCGKKYYDKRTTYEFVACEDIENLEIIKE